MQDQYLALDDSTEEISSHKKPKYDSRPLPPEVSAPVDSQAPLPREEIVVQPKISTLIPLATAGTPVPSLRVCNPENQIIVKKEPSDVLVIKKEYE